ncbi:MAG: hypothetical protein QOJ65_2742 [Fimbriimonadaceae bacterium]|nr:hypothetical protein [Fimbriimonadaceae bacterium]
MDALREHLLALLRGGQAYDTFEEIVGEFRPDERFVVPPGGERSAWQIVEHMKIALKDILEFSENEDGSYKQRDWPAEYWPVSPSGDWEGSVQGYLDVRGRMESLMSDESKDLFRVFRWGEGQTLLREALLAADHQAHHLGQLIELKRWVATLQ